MPATICSSPTASISPRANSATACSSATASSTTYYDPLIGAGIAALISRNTRAVFVEAPGSLSFEVQDVPAIAAAAHASGAVVLMDNTWASPLYFRAFDKGVDLSIQAATKYIGGHSDVMLGTVSANRATWDRLIDTVHALGLCVGPDDIYPRPARSAHHGRAAGAASPGRTARSHAGSSNGRRSRACFIRRSRAVPAMPSGSVIFPAPADCSASCFKPVAAAAVHAFLDELRLFGIGASWGGFESLAIPFDCTSIRTATQWAPGGPTVRFHIGLEDVDDLIGDLERGFARARMRYALRPSASRRLTPAHGVALRSRNSK